MAQKKILIIEDEADLRELFKTQLGDKFVFLEAKDGEEGLKTALAEKPDLILLDLMMPKMDGMTMLRKLRQDSWGKDVKVLILTNLSDGERLAAMVREGLIESGINDYIIKSDLENRGLEKRVKEKLGV